MSVIIHELDVVVEAPEQPQTRGDSGGTEANASTPPLSPQDLLDVETRQRLRELRVRAS